MRLCLFANFLLTIASTGADHMGEYSGCVRTHYDRVPENMLRVWRAPADYLPGPDSKLANKAEEHFVVVGGGAAGLTSAYILLKLGHRVTLIESSNRIGGRIKTHYGNGWYGDLGAMRFMSPAFQPLINGIFHDLGVPLVPFTTNSETKESYMWINDKYYAVEDVGMFSHRDKKESPPPKDSELNELYQLFNITKIPKNSNGGLERPTTLIGKILKSTVQRMREMCQNDISLVKFFQEELRKKEADPNHRTFWGVVRLWRSFMATSATVFLTSTGKVNTSKLYPKDGVQSQEALKIIEEYKSAFDFYQSYVENSKKEKDASFKDSRFKEIVNGTEIYIKILWDEIMALKNSNKFTYKFKTEVVGVNKLEDGKIQIEYDDRPESEKIPGGNFDFAIMTPTARAINLMEFNPSLPYLKKIALDALNYFGSVKVFLKFSRPFWSEPNKLKVINYDSKTQPNGGTGISDDLLRITYYPSNSGHGASLLATYVWEGEADYFLNHSDEECKQICLNALVKRHGEVARETYEEGVVQKWQMDQHSHGAFVKFGVSQRKDFQKALMDPVGNILFAGEYANKFHLGWVEAAVESAVKALVNQWPEEYDKRHLKEEESIFKEHSTKNRRIGPPLGPPIPQANRAAPAVASHSGLASVGEDVEDMDAGGWDWV